MSSEKDKEAFDMSNPGSHEEGVADKKSNKRGTCLCCFAIIVIGLVILILLAALAVFIALYVLERRESNEQAQTCTNEACVSLSSAILSNMDETANPCEDFYQFSCGGWDARTRIPEGEGRWSTFGELDESNQIIISKLLESDVDSSSTAVQKAQSFYSSCINVTDIEMKGVQPMINHLSSLGGWKLANINSSNGGEATVWNFSKLAEVERYAGPFFDLTVTADLLESSKQTILLYQSGLSLGIPFFYRPEVKEIYLGLITQILTLLGASNEATVLEQMSRVYDLEKALSEIFLPQAEQRNITKINNPTSIAEIIQKYNIHEDFDWLQFFKAYFRPVGSDHLITNETIVTVITEDYFSQFAAVISNFTETDFDNYVKWSLAFPYLPLLDSTIRDIYYSFSELLYGVGETPRFKTCSSAATQGLSFAVARLYQKSNIQPGTRQKMNEVIDIVQETFKNRLDSREWMDDETKKQCKNKVDKITRQIAYPDFITNRTYVDEYYKELIISPDTGYFENVLLVSQYSLNELLRQYGKPTDKSRWEIPPTSVNAYYSGSFNQFVYLAGILHPPFFDVKWPDYFLYGAIGMVVGHELTHGFDDQGQRFNAEGNIEKWWTDESQMAFDSLKKCYIDQYSGYTQGGLLIDGALTLGENIADNGGIQNSFQAYKTTPGSQNPTLPIIGEKYTNDQLFFIAFGQVWCTLYSPARLQLQIQRGPHSPGKIRVLGSLANSYDFAKAFQCPTTIYNPEQKCELW